MKKLIIGVALVVLLGGVVRAERKKADPLPPAVSLEQALQIAQTYVSTNKMNISDQCLTSIGLRTGEEGHYYWEAYWIATNRAGTEGHFFRLNVHMDKSVTLVPGK